LIVGARPKKTSGILFSMPNRLSKSASPYLRQHAENPVDWREWGDEAFDEARRLDRPVFLSVGYSSCHWCHVMAHESFECHTVAAALDRDFVSVKLDREERPDVDEIYMTAVQLASGRGGWPMSVFLTPDRRPFFAGTYFPRDDRGGHPGFLTVLASVAKMWRDRREEVERIAEDFAEAIRRTLSRSLPPQDHLSPELLHGAIQAIGEEFDVEYGGFGSAPKFPPHSALELLAEYAAWKGAMPEIARVAGAMRRLTLSKICLGGIRDHVGGGFHRYSTDRRWLLPHFEKMLYDNALLLTTLAREVEPLFVRSAKDIVSWLAQEMTDEGGLIYSALDADSGGEEGAYYVWSSNELIETLGPERAPAFLREFGCEEAGNYLDEATGRLTGLNVLVLTDDPGERFDQDLVLLRERRRTRPRPGLDDKAIAAWNGMAIEALCRAGETERAERCARVWWAATRTHGQIPHQIVGSVPSGVAFLDDLAHLAEGYLALHQVTELPEWREEAERLGRAILEGFWDDNSGAFAYTSDRHERLLARSRPATDSATPSAASVAIRVLVALGEKEVAEAALRGLSGWMALAPQATESALQALLRLLASSDASSATSWAIPAPRAENILVEVEPRTLVAGPDGWAETTVRIRLPEGMHVNSNSPPNRWLVPTEVQAFPFAIRVSYPPGDEYRGEVEIGVRVDLSCAREGELIIRYQPCTDKECLVAQERRIEIAVR
jgi:uncharacterized protein YyaL (SSP411 family)